MDKATDFELADSRNRKLRLSSFWEKKPLLLVFYPGDFTPTCTAQLCDYRDNFAGFAEQGVELVGISSDPPEKHAEFASRYGFEFPLLCDPKGEVIKVYGCTSKWTFGLMSRAVCVVNTRGEIVWRHIEAVAVTRRRAEELKSVLGQLFHEKKLP